MHNITTPDIGPMGEIVESLPSYVQNQPQLYEGKSSGMNRIGVKTLTTKPSTSAQQNKFSGK